MPFVSVRPKNKVCGNCTYINEPASDLPLLVNICREIASNGTSITALTQLAQHVRYVTGAKRWCRKEGWTHACMLSDVDLLVFSLYGRNILRRLCGTCRSLEENGLLGANRRNCLGTRKGEKGFFWFSRVGGGRLYIASTSFVT